MLGLLRIAGAAAAGTGIALSPSSTFDGGANDAGACVVTAAEMKAILAGPRGSEAFGTESATPDSGAPDQPVGPHPLASRAASGSVTPPGIISSPSLGLGGSVFLPAGRDPADSGNGQPPTGMAGLAFAGITGFGGITDTAESARPSLAGQLASFDAAFGGGGGSFWAGSGDGYTHRGSPNSDFGTDGPSGGLLGGESGGGLGGEGFQQPGVGPGGGGSGGDGGSGPGPTGESDPPPEFLNSPPIILGNGEPPSLSADGSHAPIPEPTAIAPFGAGLLLLAFGSRRLTSSSEKKR